MKDYILEQDRYFPISDVLLDSLERYLNHGISGGSFMTAVLENNLAEAFGRADMCNTANMKNIVGYIYNHMPSESWGSREKVTQWTEKLQQTKRSTSCHSN